MERGDTGAMADGLIRLLQDERLAREISAKAEPAVRAAFSAEAMAKDYMELGYGPLIHTLRKRGARRPA